MAHETTSSQRRPSVALVTGAGTGIGRAVALRLARDGAAVIAAGNERGPLDAVTREALSLGVLAVPALMDVTDPESVRTAMAAATAETGAPGIVVACAGIASSNKFEKLTAHDWRKTLDVNVTGVALTIQACLPAMRAAKRGRIVAIGSTMSLQGAPYIAHYVASKHAVLGLVRALATEVARDGITVNCVCPGFVDTEMTARTIGNIVATTGRTAEEALRSIEAQSPQKRLIRPEEIADAVAYLCSDAAGGVSGQALVVNGG